MITRTMKAADYQTSCANWQIELTQAIDQLPLLLTELELDPATSPAGLILDPTFPLRVPRGYAARMTKKNWQDPLLLQVLPQSAESHILPGYHQDPLQEAAANPVPGLLHKYHDRALWIVTGACAVHCRYCFRRHFPYQANQPGRAGWEAICTYLQQHSEIKELILSGGDPLTVKDSYLAELLTALASVPHLQRVRFHSRIPVVLPSRITPALLEAMTCTRLKPVMVLHINHAQEIDKNVQTAVQSLRALQIPVFNQAVLLRGINDTATTLVQLSEALFASGILPYYLHMLDPVQGAAHFAVPRAEAQQLMQTIIQQLPGYLVPKLVQEIPGARSKLPVHF